MGRLVPGAFGLLLLASVAVHGEAHKAMKKMTLQDFKNEYQAKIRVIAPIERTLFTLTD